MPSPQLDRLSSLYLYSISRQIRALFPQPYRFQAPTPAPAVQSMSGRTEPHTSRPAPRSPPATKQHGRPPPSILPPIVAFYIFLLANVLAAAYAPIQDCDEVFNYWEPTHYLTHGYGLQTWEYSPEFAIRSWAYVTLHAVASKLASVLPFTSKARY